MGKRIRIKRSAPGDNGSRTLRKAAAEGRLNDPLDALSDAERHAVERIRAKAAARSTEDLTHEQGLLLDLADARDSRDAEAEMVKVHQQALLDELDGAPHGHKVQAVDTITDTVVAGTLVRPAPGKELDADGLLEALREGGSTDVIDAITSMVVDEAKLEKAVASGLISKDVIDKHITDGKVRAPHIRLNRKVNRQ